MMHSVDIMEKGCKLTEVVLERNVDQVRSVLIAGGVNVNKRDANGRTVLHNGVSACGERVEIVKLLLEAGADATVADNHGNTALHWCSDVDIIDLLVAHGAGVNTRNKGGLTPRAMAARRGVEEEVLAHLEFLETQGVGMASAPPSPRQRGASSSSDRHRSGRGARCADTVTMSVLVDFYRDIGPRNMVLLVLGLLFLSFYFAYTFIGLPTFDDSRVSIDGYSYRMRI